MVSIIVPMYNSECYLEECLSSVLKQTYDDFELLLIDDGSVDSTCAICNEFMKRDMRIRLYIQKHSGVSTARNAALDVAQGEYIFFMDSDDVIIPVTLEVLLEQILLQEADMALCQYKEAEKGFSGENVPVISDRKWLRFDSYEVIEQFSQNNRIFGGIWGKLIRRSAIGNLRFDESLFLGEDTLFLYELVCKGISAVYILDNMYYYRKNGTGTWPLRFTLEGTLEAGRVFKRIEFHEQNHGRIENARFWEGEYLRILKRAMDCLPGAELCQMRKDVIKEMGDPYFQGRPLRTKGAIFLAFFLHPLYCWGKWLKRFI